MKHLLTPENRKLLLQFALSNVLVTFDYDGTLAPIVADRDHATMRQETRQLLAEVAKQYPCAVISGRALTDVRAYLEGISIRYLVGNHGMEPHENMGHFRRLASQIRLEIQPQLNHVQGLELEDKQYSLAIHYRRSRQRQWARNEVVRAITCLTIPVRVVPGKLVLNILPKDAPHKGTALQALRARQSADTAIYVGDDDTDEDVFQLDEPGRLLSVRVARSSTTAAQFYIQNQSEIDELLAFLASARQKGVSNDQRGGLSAR